MARLISFPKFHPMRTFDPTKPAMVHDELNDVMVEFDPTEHRAHYERYAVEDRPGVIEWDGRLLDGWMPVTQH
jgi:hypothetical protein